MVNIPIFQEQETSPFAGFLSGLGSGIGGGISGAISQQLDDYSQIEDSLGLQKGTLRKMSPQAREMFIKVKLPMLKQQQQLSRDQQLLSLLGINLPEGSVNQENIAPRETNTIGTVPGEYSREGVVTRDQRFEPERFSDEQIAAISLINPNVGKVLQSQKDSRMRKIEVKANLHNKISGKYLEKINEMSAKIPQLDNALHSMESSVLEEDLSFFSKDYLADKTGIELFRTAKGAEFKAAAKEYLLGNIGRAGNKPNEWIERQIESATGRIGRDKEANLIWVEAQRLKNNIDKKHIELSHEIADDYEERLGYVPRNISDLVNKRLDPYIKSEQEITKRKMEEILSKKGGVPDKSSNDLVRVQLPNGAIGSIPRKNLKNAINQGAKLLK